jgi:hypothetical protein
MPVLEREQREFFETVRLSEVQRERQMVDWMAQMEAHHTRMSDFGAQMRDYSKQHEAAQRLFPALEKFQQQLLQQQNQAAELQRIAEVRQKQELAQWQEDTDRRWKKQEVVWNHQWHEQERTNAEYAQRLSALDEMQTLLRAQVKALWQLQQSFAQQRFETVRAWQAHLEEFMGEHARE